jgi:hypothetical protein
MNRFEEWALLYTGKILEAVGVGGAIFTIFFDKIARGLYQQMDWLQITGIACFALLAIFGVAVDKFLGDVKCMMEDYLRGE